MEPVLVTGPPSGVDELCGYVLPASSPPAGAAGDLREGGAELAPVFACGSRVEDDVSLRRVEAAPCSVVNVFLRDHEVCVYPGSKSVVWDCRAVRRADGPGFGGVVGGYTCHLC